MEFNLFPLKEDKQTTNKTNKILKKRKSFFLSEPRNLYF